MSKYHDAMKKLFDTQREGKGVEKGPKAPQNFTGFFKYFKMHLNDIFKVNLILLFGNFPIFFAIYALTGNLNRVSTSPISPIFPQLHGAMLHTQGSGISPSTMALFGVHGVQGELSALTTATTIVFSLTALIIFTMGPITTGCTYLFRNLLKGEPLFFFADFKHAIKRNLRQSLILRIIDCLIFTILTYNIVLSYFNMETFLTETVMFANILLMFLYILMRPYLYIMLVTFDLSIFKLFKNALIFAIIGAKRNIPAFIGASLLIFINYMLVMVFIPVGISLILFISIGTVWYIYVYAAFPKIKEIMIDPYYETEEEN